eukprot:SAG31_NODE_3289_length_4458_cov_2.567791_6_plen_74_part_00
MLSFATRARFRKERKDGVEWGDHMRLDASAGHTDLVRNRRNASFIGTSRAQPRNATAEAVAVADITSGCNPNR